MVHEPAKIPFRLMSICLPSEAKHRGSSCVRYRVVQSPPYDTIRIPWQRDIAYAQMPIHTSLSSIQATFTTMFGTPFGFRPFLFGCQGTNIPLKTCSISPKNQTQRKNPQNSKNPKNSRRHRMLATFRLRATVLIAYSVHGQSRVQRMRT